MESSVNGTDMGLEADGDESDVMAEGDEEERDIDAALDQFESILSQLAGREAAARVPVPRPLSKGRAPERRRRGTTAVVSEGSGETAAVRAPRRVRRWGEAARKAAQNEIADGGRAVPRSMRAIREAFPLSQRELAQRTRLARSTIAALEGGQQRARPSTRRVIARVLRVEVGEIAWG